MFPRKIFSRRTERDSGSVGQERIIPLIFKANKTGTSKVGAISKAQKAQSFLNMPRMYS